MVRSIIFIALIFLVGSLSWMGLPWWFCAVVALLVAWSFGISAWKSFLLGFIAGVLLWWGGAMVSHWPNGGILAARIGDLLAGMLPWHLLLITAALGGVLTGLGAMAGSHLYDILQKK